MLISTFPRTDMFAAQHYKWEIPGWVFVNQTKVTIRGPQRHGPSLAEHSSSHTQSHFDMRTASRKGPDGLIGCSPCALDSQLRV
jgi:hypothetical protein